MSAEDADYMPSQLNPPDSSIANMSRISSEHFMIANQAEAGAAGEALPVPTEVGGEEGSKNEDQAQADDEDSSKPDDTPKKRGRGRPRKHPPVDADAPKRPRGRPKKAKEGPDDDPEGLNAKLREKRGRGRPRKDQIVE